MNIYQTIISKRKNGDVFSKIRKDLIESKKYNEIEVTKAIGKIHDYEAEVLKTELEKKKGLSFFFGGLIFFLSGLGYTLFTYFNESLSSYILLYGPLIAGFGGAAIGLEKFKSAKNYLSTLENKFKIKM